MSHFSDFQKKNKSVVIMSFYFILCLFFMYFDIIFSVFEAEQFIHHSQCFLNIKKREKKLSSR